MIEEIYQKQLEAILFSVNQYSDNALESWLTKAEAGFQEPIINNQIPLSIEALLTNSTIEMTFVIDSVKGNSQVRSYSQDSTAHPSNDVIRETLEQNKALIDKLIGYKLNGFQKSVVLENSQNLKILIFLIGGISKPMQVAGFVINPDALIEDLIGPRLQIIAKDQFILTVYRKDSQSPLYSTQLGDTTRLSSEAFTKDLWIFPDYALGIRTMGASVQQLVRARTSTNLYLLVGLSLILIIALILVYRNVKKEVQLAQNKSDFVSNVSHEIRTPLALISMFAETLEMDRIKSEEKKMEYYSIISKEANRLSGIVNRILTFSQTEAGKKTFRIEPLDLSTRVAEVLKTYDFHLKNKGFEYTITEVSSLQVKADKEALTEMVINLIDNAMKYSHEVKRIEIKLGSDLDFGWISIRDFGVGISKADQKHIFDKFYRVSSGNLASAQGTGLGLSLVKQLIEKQNGKISVISTLGQGSTFTLYFPIA